MLDLGHFLIHIWSIGDSSLGYMLQFLRNIVSCTRVDIDKTWPVWVASFPLDSTKYMVRHAMMNTDSLLVFSKVLTTGGHIVEFGGMICCATECLASWFACSSKTPSEVGALC